MKLSDEIKKRTEDLLVFVTAKSSDEYNFLKQLIPKVEELENLKESPMNVRAVLSKKPNVL